MIGIRTAAVRQGGQAQARLRLGLEDRKVENRKLVSPETSDWRTTHDDLVDPVAQAEQGQQEGHTRTWGHGAARIPLTQGLAVPRRRRQFQEGAAQELASMAMLMVPERSSMIPPVSRRRGGRPTQRGGQDGHQGDDAATSGPRPARKARRIRCR